MADTVGDFLLSRLREWGVEQVFGYPGDGINGLLAAWGRAGNRPGFIQARHEEMAAFEAVGYAKFSGQFAVAERAPTAIILPSDVQELPYDPPGHAFKMVPSSLGWAQPRVAPDEEAIRQAAVILNSGERVAILVGQGARSARQQVMDIAERLGAGWQKLCSVRTCFLMTSRT